jgi:hypothetical protein
MMRASLSDRDEKGAIGSERERREKERKIKERKRREREKKKREKEKREKREKEERENEREREKEVLGRISSIHARHRRPFLRANWFDRRRFEL